MRSGICWSWRTSRPRGSERRGAASRAPTSARPRSMTRCFRPESLRSTPGRPSECLGPNRRDAPRRSGASCCERCRSLGVLDRRHRASRAPTPRFGLSRVLPGCGRRTGHRRYRRCRRASRHPIRREHLRGLHPQRTSRRAASVAIRDVGVAPGDAVSLRRRAFVIPGPVLELLIPIDVPVHQRRVLVWTTQPELIDVQGGSSGTVRDGLGGHASAGRTRSKGVKSRSIGHRNPLRCAQKRRPACCWGGRICRLTKRGVPTKS